MLQKLNERIKGIIAWVVISFISFTFVLFGVDYYLQSKRASDKVASVNGQDISSTELEKNYRRIQQQQQSYGQSEDEKQLKASVLESLILNTLLIQSAHHMGLLIGLNQANALIVQMSEFQDDKHFSSARYQQALRSVGLTPTGFLEEVKQGMLINQVRFAFIGSDFVLSNELKHYAELLFQKRNYDYAIFSLSDIKTEKISESEAKRYYEQHPEKFTTPLQLKIAYLLLSPDSVSEPRITEQDVHRYYEENQADFKKPARYQVSHILFAFNNESGEQETAKKATEAYKYLQKHPERFSEWVEHKSDDLLSRKNKGQLPWMTAGDQTFGMALSQLSHKGQISPPIRTQQGYELLKLLAIEPAKMMPFESVKTQIKNQLASEKKQQVYAKKLELLNELSYQHPESLQVVSESLNLPILYSEPFSKDVATEPLTRLPKVIAAAFSDDVLLLGNNSEVIQINDNQVLVLRVEKRFPEKLKPFSSVKADIEKDLQLQAARKLIEAFPLQNLSQDDDMGAALPKLTWHSIEKASREANSSASPLIHHLAFEMGRVNEVKGVFLPEHRYAFVRLKKVVPGEYEALSSEQQQALSQQLATLLGGFDYDIYMKGLMADASVTKH